MILALLALGLMVLFGAGAWQPRHLHPAHEARLRSVGMASGLLLVEAGLVLWASPLLLRAVGRPDLAAACEVMLGGPLPFRDAAGVGAAVAAALLPSRLVAGTIKVQSWQRRYRVEPWLGAVNRHETYDVVVLPSGRLGAYTVGGRRPQIVLTRGVFENLSPGCADVITAHEKAHADNRHHRFIMLASAVTAALGWLPPVHTGTDRLRLALERWADEEAALTVGLGRQGVRETLLEVLSRLLEVPVGAAGFGEASMVGNRLRALAGGPPPAGGLRVSSAYVAAGLLLAATASAAVWSGHGLAAAVVELGRCCHS